MIHLDYRDARPIYTQIFDNIRLQIRTKVLQEGDKLPSVRELAGQLAINPNTIQRAYRELEAAGWIATVPGKGCFVCGIPDGEAQPVQKLWENFDAAAAALRNVGITTRMLLEHLEQGGNQNA